MMMKKLTEDLKNIKIVHKIIFGVGSAVIILTLLSLVICCIAYPSAINFFTTATLPPVAVVLVSAFGFCLGIWGKVDPRKKAGWKYSKVDGKGNFVNEYNEREPIGKSLTGGCISFLIMSLLLPFVFFFPDKVKNIAGIAALVTISLALLGFFIVIGVIIGVENKKERERKKAEAKRLRREQEKREQMGEWK